MNACIFAGPTLPPGDEARAFPATWLPPAQQGDVYRAVALLRPRSIGIVDGYFQWVPSVLHKEILWAMREGVHVFGAASMGALRAAELAPFGMRGVGRIFEAYRSGVLVGHGEEPFEDDDEVAVVHGPAESGYLALSEAMVNIRRTLAAAQGAGAIDGATRARLVALAKALFFPDRSYARLLECARAAALSPAQLAALEAWLPAGRVNQKREDALAMLAAMREFLATDPGPGPERFSFEHTILWGRAVADAMPAAVHTEEEARVLEELRLAGARQDALWDEAMRRLVHPAGAPAKGDAPARASAERAAYPRDGEQRLADAGRQAALRRLSAQVPVAVVERQMLARMRETGEYERLRARAEDKRARVATLSDLPAVEDVPELRLLQLQDWFFATVLEREIPDDIHQCVSAWGYGDLTHFHRAIYFEHVYRQMTASAAERAGAGGGSGR